MRGGRGGNRRSSGRRVLIAIGILAAAAIGALAAIAISSSGRKSENRIAAKTVTEFEPAPRAPTEEAAAGSSNVNRPVLEPFDGRLYTAEVPVNWTSEKIEEKISGRYESQWRNPEDENTSVLIDSQSHRGTTSALEDAEAVRSEASLSDGYREISLEPIMLEGLGVPAARWVFEVEDDRRVDYFFASCGVGFAVLGSSSPGTFRAWSPTFSAVANSVFPRCE